MTNEMIVTRSRGDFRDSRTRDISIAEGRRILDNPHETMHDSTSAAYNLLKGIWEDSV